MGRRVWHGRSAGTVRAVSGTDPEALAAAEERLARQAPGYLERARQAAASRGVPAEPSARARRALELVDETATVNADVPTMSRRRWGGPVKAAVGRLVRWYMVHLSDQVTELGASVAWFGHSMVDYVAALEEEVSELRSRVAELERDRRL